MAITFARIDNSYWEQNQGQMGEAVEGSETEPWPEQTEFTLALNYLLVWQYDENEGVFEAVRMEFE